MTTDPAERNELIAKVGRFYLVMNTLDRIALVLISVLMLVGAVSIAQEPNWLPEWLLSSGTGRQQRINSALPKMGFVLGVGGVLYVMKVLLFGMTYAFLSAVDSLFKIASRET